MANATRPIAHYEEQYGVVFLILRVVQLRLLLGTIDLKVHAVNDADALRKLLLLRVLNPLLLLGLRPALDPDVCTRNTNQLRFISLRRSAAQRSAAQRTVVLIESFDDFLCPKLDICFE